MRKRSDTIVHLLESTLLHNLMLRILLAIETDETPISPLRESLFQEQAMRHLIRFTGHRRSRLAKRQSFRFEAETLEQCLLSRKLLKPNQESLHVCSWIGVNCESEVITSIQSLSFPFSPNLAWLPSTCAYVTMDNSKSRMKEEFHIAYLPRALIEGAFTALKLRGELELRSLPHRMTSLNLNANLFSGTVNLTSLPATMNYLYLQNNAFAFCVYESSLLPDSFNAVFLSKVWEKQQLRFVHHGPKNDPRIYLV